jgi:hypothetical protein
MIVHSVVLQHGTQQTGEAALLQDTCTLHTCCRALRTYELYQLEDRHMVGRYTINMVNIGHRGQYDNGKSNDILIADSTLHVLGTCNTCDAYYSMGD